MHENTRRRIEALANIAIVVTAVLLCTVLIKHLASKPEPSVPQSSNQPNQMPGNRERRASRSPQPGTQLLIDGVNWAASRQTLVLALSDKCHFCTESAPFYQRLARERRNTRLVVVVPQTVDQGRAYLSQLRVDADDIKQMSFRDLGVSGTPTLVLVDGKGAAVRSWTGKLPASAEAEVLSSLQ